jgi:hypothetical protein
MAGYTKRIYNFQYRHLSLGPIGKCGGDNFRLWEYTAGFGFEEWYRNPKFQKEDENGVIWQFGYWQCFKNPKNHNAGVYNNFEVYSRICNHQQKSLTANTIIAIYKEIHVLDESERRLMDIHFQHEIIEIRDLLAITIKRDGTLIDVNNNFDGEPSGESRFNIRFRLEDETYLFSEAQNLKIERGGFRFGLYEG